MLNLQVIYIQTMLTILTNCVRNIQTPSDVDVVDCFSVAPVDIICRIKV